MYAAKRFFVLALISWKTQSLNYRVDIDTHSYWTLELTFLRYGIPFTSSLALILF
jgi:hypothetical protein